MPGLPFAVRDVGVKGDLFALALGAGGSAGSELGMRDGRYVDMSRSSIEFGSSDASCCRSNGSGLISGVVGCSTSV